MKYLKKFLILLGVCLTSFLLIDNASAFEILDSSITPGKDNFLQQIKFINTYSMSDEEIRELVSLYESNTAYQTTNITSSTVEEYLEKKNWIDNNKSNLGNYFLSNYYLNYNINFNNFKAYINSTFESSTDKSNYPLGYYGNIRLHLSFGVNTYYYDWKSSSKTFTRHSYPQTSDTSLSSYNLLSKTILNAIYVYFYECNFESNFIIDSTPSRLNNAGSSYNDGFNYKDKILYPGDIIEETTLTGFNFIDLGPKEPELDISLIEKTDYSESIKINFNIWDTEKYIYQYKLTGMEVWEDITENDFEYISYSNNTIYIQMIDKTTNESILNATYTFSNITETIPDITFNESIPNSCKILKNGTNYIVCKEIKANFNNYYGINNYLWSYSADSENWTQIYNDKFIDIISENKAIYFKLYDRYTNETLKYMTYNITGIELIPSDLGQYITFNGKYENNNYKLDIIFYNYNNELYNYYYSTDGENWIQLSLAEMSNYTSIYSKYKSFNFYKDMTVYVKIEDKEANYINSATYQIKIPNVGLFDTINNFKVDNKILNYFTNIYNQIRTSDLGNYIFMLIVTSIILLIIKSARR